MWGSSIVWAFSTPEKETPKLQICKHLSKEEMWERNNTTTTKTDSSEQAVLGEKSLLRRHEIFQISVKSSRIVIILMPVLTVNFGAAN